MDSISKWIWSENMVLFSSYLVSTKCAFSRCRVIDGFDQQDIRKVVLIGKPNIEKNMKRRPVLGQVEILPRRFAVRLWRFAYLSEGPHYQKFQIVFFWIRWKIYLGMSVVQILSRVGRFTEYRTIIIWIRNYHVEHNKRTIDLNDIW